MTQGCRWLPEPARRERRKVGQTAALQVCPTPNAQRQKSHISHIPPTREPHFTHISHEKGALHHTYLPQESHISPTSPTRREPYITCRGAPYHLKGYQRTDHDKEACKHQKSAGKESYKHQKSARKKSYKHQKSARKESYKRDVRKTRGLEKSSKRVLEKSSGRVLEKCANAP